MSLPQRILTRDGDYYPPNMALELKQVLDQFAADHPEEVAAAVAKAEQGLVSMGVDAPKLSEAQRAQLPKALHEGDTENFGAWVIQQMTYLEALGHYQLARLDRFEKLVDCLREHHEAQQHGKSQPTNVSAQPTKEEVDGTWAAANERARRPIGT